MTDFEVKQAPSGLWEVYENDGWGGKRQLGNFDKKSSAVSATEDLLRRETGINRMLIVNKSGITIDTINYMDGVEQ